MFHLENIEDELYMYALSLFQASGHADTSLPAYCNHTPEEVIYFDSQSDLALSKMQRSMLNCVACISHLFSIDSNTFDKESGDSIGFYSMEVLSTKSCRSQTAHEIHRVFGQALCGSANVILFGHDDQIMLSMQGFGSEVFLSDWFLKDVDFDTFAERIHICGMSLKSARDYFTDFVYSCARWYYITPVLGRGVEYDILPINYFSSRDSIMDFGTVNREELKEQIRSSLRKAEIEYGDDFVERETACASTIDIGAELDLIALEMDMDEDQDGLVDEEINDKDSRNKDDEFEDPHDTPKDEYEYSNIDDGIFRDPTLMVKWLQKNDDHYASSRNYH